jgi:hypothetical protein
MIRPLRAGIEITWGISVSPNLWDDIWMWLLGTLHAHCSSILLTLGYSILKGC